MRLNKSQIKKATKVLQALFPFYQKVVFAYIYGSALLFIEKRQSIPPHDIDVAIYVKDADAIKLEMDLQMAFYKKTGLLPEMLDVRSLNNAPLSVRIEILTKGRLIFCRDELFHAEYIEQTSNLYRQLSGLIEAAYA